MREIIIKREKIKQIKEIETMRMKYKNTKFLEILINTLWKKHVGARTHIKERTHVEEKT